MKHSDHSHPTPESEASCTDCADLRRLFASVDPGPPPADLRSAVRARVEAEPTPVVAGRRHAWAGAAAAAFLVGMLLAPLAGDYLAPGDAGQMPGVAQIARNLDDTATQADLALTVRKGSHDVRLEWMDGENGYVVEKSHRPNAWEEAQKIPVRSPEWSDGLGDTGTRLTYYRVQPASEIVP